VLALAALYIFWSCTFFALRVLVVAVPPLLAAGCRFVLAGMVLGVILKFRGSPWPTGKQWLVSLPIGGLMFLVGNGFVCMAEKTASSGAAAVALGSIPLWVVVLGRWFGVRSSKREWFGVFLGLAGVILLAAGGTTGTVWSTLLLILAPIGWALGSLFARGGRLPTGLMSAVTPMIAGGTLTAVVGLLSGEKIPTYFPPSALLAFGYLVVFGSLLGFSAFNYLLRTTRPAVAMSYAYVNPTAALILGALVGGEVVSWQMAMATGLIVLAVVLLMSKETPSQTLGNIEKSQRQEPFVNLVHDGKEEESLYPLCNYVITVTASV
jgi:drug/metabolite transporter (DMT)-like permease